MTISEIYRTLEPEERILEGDQFKMRGLPDQWWAPVETFIGHRVRELAGQNVIFRRIIVREVNP